ncbi:MAG: hypothetical protein QXL93_00855 [Candidatus Nitrosocaldus sp.]
MGEVMNDQRKAMNGVFKEIEEDLRAIKVYMARRTISKDFTPQK